MAYASITDLTVYLGIDESTAESDAGDEANSREDLAR